MDVAKVERGEMVESELDRLIEKRSAVEDPEALDELWLRSVERHNEAIRRQNRAGWYGYHMHMSELHARLAADHERRAEKLCEEGAA